MIDLRYPNITGNSEREQLAQMKSYLHQLVGELQFAIGGIETTSSSLSYTTKETGVAQVPSSSNHQSSSNAEANFASIKALIIKSADIVEAYYEEINKKLQGEYLAISDFGIYKESTQLDLNATSERITQNYTNVQEISANLAGAYDSMDALDSDLREEIQASNDRIDEANNALSVLEGDIGDTNSRVDNLGNALQTSTKSLQESIRDVDGSVSLVNELLEGAKSQLQGSINDIKPRVESLETFVLETKAYVKTGALYNTDGGVAAYGIEVGQNVDVNGQEVYRKYARFTSEKLSFYDANDIEVAYISDKKLYIRIAEITVSFQIGGLIDVVMSNGDVVTKWVGEGD